MHLAQKQPLMLVIVALLEQFVGVWPRFLRDVATSHSLTVKAFIGV